MTFLVVQKTPKNGQKRPRNGAKGAFFLFHPPIHP
jgi:hypothetical protein